VSVSQKRLELKSLKVRTKAEELRTPGPELLSLRPPLTGLSFEPVCRHNVWKLAEPRVHRGGADPLLKYTHG
jgi:hypothetical protein